MTTTATHTQKARRPAALPASLRRITPGQARRLYAIATREGGYSTAALERMLRFYGFRRIDDVTEGCYEDLCSIAATPAAARAFSQPVAIEGERPHVAHASEEDFPRAVLFARASDAYLQRQVVRAFAAIEAADPGADGAAYAEYARACARDVRLCLEEITYRLASSQGASLQGANLTLQTAQPP